MRAGFPKSSRLFLSPSCVSSVPERILVSVF